MVSWDDDIHMSSGTFSKAAFNQKPGKFVSFRVVETDNNPKYNYTIELV